MSISENNSRPHVCGGGGTASCPLTAAGPEHMIRMLKNKDRMIRVQAQRIEILESEVERLRAAKESLSYQLAVVSHRLELVTVGSSASTTIQSLSSDGVNTQVRCHIGGGGVGQTWRQCQQGNRTSYQRYALLVYTLACLLFEMKYLLFGVLS